MRATRSERLASETSEERTARLQQVSANRRERLASETAEERTARLQQMSANQHERLASETAEERTARLQYMSANQHERLASETAEEREVRLQYYSDRHRELQVVQSQLPLFELRSVRTKMLRFHAHMASLDSSQCSTCSERFPGLRLAHSLLSAYAAVATSTVQRCTLHSTTWTQAPYHLSYRLVHLYAEVLDLYTFSYTHVLGNHLE